MLSVGMQKVHLSVLGSLASLAHGGVVITLEQLIPDGLVLGAVEAGPTGGRSSPPRVRE